MKDENLLCLKNCGIMEDSKRVVFLMMKVRPSSDLLFQGGGAGVVSEYMSAIPQLLLD